MDYDGVRRDLQRSQRQIPAGRRLLEAFDPGVAAGKQKPQILGVGGEHDHRCRQGDRSGGHNRVDRKVAMFAPRSRRPRPKLTPRDSRLPVQRR